MQAPVPKPVPLSVDRVRCSCQTETLLFFAAPWYEGQETLEYEPACVGCGKSLLAQSRPFGTKIEAYALNEVPADLAFAISEELAKEVSAARTGEVEDPPGGLSAERWTEPHEAPAAYAAWVEAQPAPAGPVSRAEIREWVGAAALVANYVVFCILV